MPDEVIGIDDSGMIELAKRIEKSNELSRIKETLEDAVNYNKPIALTPEQSAMLLECIPWYEA